MKKCCKTREDYIRVAREMLGSVRADIARSSGDPDTVILDGYIEVDNPDFTELGRGRSCGIRLGRGYTIFKADLLYAIRVIRSSATGLLKRANRPAFFLDFHLDPESQDIGWYKFQALSIWTIP